jgi:hypothetical protein
MSSLDGQGDYVSSGSWSFEAREKEVRGSLVFNGAINNLLFGGPESNLRDNLPLQLLVRLVERVAEADCPI